jgi:phospholipase D1/2
MITPYFMLKRPNELLKREYRLDGILEELAKRNVKIYIVLYQEPKIAINNDSEFVKKYLEEIGGNNIKVIRHPNYIVIPFLWSHHEKIVLIDQKVAFLGGLDICYGRWDTQNHSLHNPDTESFWEGADYCNLRIRDIYKPRDYMMSNLTLSEPKMPWHDVAIQIQGPSVNDIARHFTNYWNFVNFQTKIDNDR